MIEQRTYPVGTRMVHKPTDRPGRFRGWVSPGMEEGYFVPDAGDGAIKVNRAALELAAPEERPRAIEMVVVPSYGGLLDFLADDRKRLQLVVEHMRSKLTTWLSMLSDQERTNWIAQIEQIEPSPGALMAKTDEEVAETILLWLAESPEWMP